MRGWHGGDRINGWSSFYEWWNFILRGWKHVFEWGDNQYEWWWKFQWKFWYRQREFRFWWSYLRFGR